ncbi:MAG: hypothetical protein V1811_02350, partial [Candidatus Micrarchaeota archaeon]
MNIDNSAIMNFMYQGLSAAIGCTSLLYAYTSGEIEKDQESELLKNFFTAETIGDAFDTYKRLPPIQRQWGNYDKNCVQLYGDPTIRMVD